MKALSIRQPWAGLIAAEIKTVETRTWRTKYRGPLLIVAGKEIDYAAYYRFGKAGTPYSFFPQGEALAIVNLVNVTVMSEVHEKAAMLPARPGLYAWTLELVGVVRSFPVKGKLGLFEVPDNLIYTLEQIADQQYEAARAEALADMEREE